MDYEKFLHLARALAAHRVEYILVGGVALGVHGLLRATEDIDLFVRPTEENIVRLQAALRSVWDDPEVHQITIADLGGDYPTVRYGPPGEGFVIDLLSRLGTAFSYEDLEFETILLEGAPIRVASPRTLYRMKRDTLRPIDQADAAALREKFGLGDD
jgi:hypothetical protein